jgi:WD40-like Beta Propeller Repeat
MIDERDLFVRASQRFDPPTDAYERFNHRRDRRRRNQRLGAFVVAVVVAVAVFGGIARAIQGARRTKPIAPTPTLFDQVHGWIAVGTRSGIEAIDPDHPSRRIPLTTEAGIPLAWSNDGSLLLVSDSNGWSVLRSDGSLTHVPHTQSGSGAVGGAFPGLESFTPDGREVVIAVDLAIKAIDITTGAERTIVPGDTASRTGFGGCLLSPDGTTLAVGRTVHGHDRGLWLMNSDGSGLRSLVDRATIARLYGAPNFFQDWLPGAWSPDGRQITFNVDGHEHFVVAVVNADGSSLHRVTPADGRSLFASWSPDGRRISATNEANVLRIMDADGSHVRNVPFDEGGAPFLFGVWNPVPPS